MASDRARLRRARLIERVRSAEQRKAAGEVFRAGAIHQKLEQLSERTRSLGQLYALRDSSEDGADLRAASIVGSHLQALGNTAARQADQAREEADRKVSDLAHAERRRQRAEDARRELHRSVRDGLAKPDGVPIRKIGTHLE